MKVGITRRRARAVLRSRLPDLLVLWAVLFLIAPLAKAQTPVRKNVLIINEVGPAHTASALVTEEVMSRLSADRRYQTEFYLESLDTPLFSKETSREGIEAGIARDYGNRQIDAIIAMGPAPIRFLARVSDTFLPGVPVVFCGSTQAQAGYPKLSSRFTGSWLTFNAENTLEAAMRLYPGIRNVAVVSGSSQFDQAVLRMTQASFEAHPLPLDITYLTNLDMSSLLERLRHLPAHTVVLYLSFFRDANGSQFVNATTALPLVSKAANAPVFGVSDAYLGHGIVGGYVVSFADQAKVAARITAEIFRGKNPGDIPVVAGASFYAFDWKQLQRWNLSEARLPPGSVVLNREPRLWEKAKGILLLGLVVILGLAALAGFLLWEKKQLNAARKEQMRLGGLLINAHEQERSRLAAEIHDDFSQRLAVLSLGLETTAEAIPQSMEQTNRQMHELIESASELGADLHTLSHRLHSSTLERLGLAAGVGSFCKEFTAQHGTQIEFCHHNVPRFVSPEIALCFFRVVQEGLRNVQKHSGAAHAQVQLERIDDALHLTISDDGQGFDMKDRFDAQGLGLWSMRERVRLVGGRFEIHSAIQQGTRIEVWTPLTEASSAVRREPVNEALAGTPITAD